MWRIFDIAMRIVSSLIGLLMIMAGSVWMLQGLNLAFRVGFMVGDKHWTVYGAVLALVGVCSADLDQRPPRRIALGPQLRRLSDFRFRTADLTRRGGCDAGGNQ